MKLRETPESDILTPEEMEVGMRVTLPDGSMPGVITAVNDEKVAVKFDNTERPTEYRHGRCDFVREAA